MMLPKKRRLVGVLVVSMGGYVLYSYYGSNSSTTQDAVYVGSPITVSTGNIVETLSFDGTTTFANTQKLTFGQEGKKVTNVFVKVGDTVKQDQVLATLESSDLDSSLKTAKANLVMAQLNYDKAVANSDKNYDLLKAQSALQTAQSNLYNIDTTITVDNNDEDNNITKAQQTLTDAQDDYQDLYNESVGAQSDATRNKRNTYTDAIDDLRDITNSVQTNLDSIDKIMYFTDKFKQGSQTKASIYIGSKDTSSLQATQIIFSDVNNMLAIVQSDYKILSARPIDEVTSDDLQTAYQHVTDLAKSVMNLGTRARTMFENTIVSSNDMTQTMIDSDIALANTIYSNGRSIKDKGTATMESVYKIDDTTDLTQAKQMVANAQIALDKLLLNKKNREANNAAKRVSAQLAVLDAQKTISAIQNGYNDTSVQNASNQLIQAQANLDSVLKKYENYELIANFNGTVTEVNVQPGDTVTSSNNSDTYIYVENPNLIEIALDVEQTDILKLSVGDHVSIALDVFSDDVFSGVISEISTVPITSNGVSTYAVKAMFEKPADKNILGGMTATVSVTTSQKKNILVVPNSALTLSGSSYYITRQDGTRSEVQVGDADSNVTEIVSGLSYGDTILDMMISSQDLSTSGVSSSDQSSSFPGGPNRSSQSQAGGGNSTRSSSQGAGGVPSQ